MDKKTFLKSIGLLAGFSALAKWSHANTMVDENFTPTIDDLAPTTANEFALAPLPYAYDALEPVIDKQTMEIHHGRHHKAYVDNLNKALANNPVLKTKTIEELMVEINRRTEPAIRNNGGGHWNHTFFWESLTPTKNMQPGAKTMAGINKAFGSFDKFKEAFTKEALGRFGSGWAWLCIDRKGDFYICSTANQDNPLMRIIAEKPGKPILGIDVWEHAYYLKYQNKRADYVKGLYAIINWDKVEARV
jgi:superoxide dismutase, Fe-Mn family